VDTRGSSQEKGEQIFRGMRNSREEEARKAVAVDLDASTKSFNLKAE
jgi:hypothetical protein